MDTETAEGLRARVDEMRGALTMRNLGLVKRGSQMEMPVVEAEPISGRAPAVVLGEKVVRTKLRGGLAVLETESGVTVLLDARAVRLAAIALGVVLAR